MKPMTGAQERALTRLERKHKVHTVLRSTADLKVHVQWTEKDRDGEPRPVKAEITPEGRVVTLP